jgi:Amidase
MHDLHFLELAALAELIRTRAISPVEITVHQLDRIAALDGKLASFGRRRRTSSPVVTAGHSMPFHWPSRTSSGPEAHECTGHDNQHPLQAKRGRHCRPPTAPGGRRAARQAANDRGAYSDHHPQVAPPRSPWNADYLPGISSSGPGVAVAAGLCFGALASDTRGSIRCALSRCDAKMANGLRHTDFQAAAITSRNVLIAAVRSVRCVMAEVRWRCTLKGVVTLPVASARCQRLKNCQAAATAVRHVSIAAARSVRCVWAEVRWRWTLKVLYTAACVERNFCAEPGLLNRCILRSPRRVG